MYKDGDEEVMVAKQKMVGLNGDEASAYATKQVDPDVVAAYPITPQTSPMGSLDRSSSLWSPSIAL
jgi:hypothetical protein